MAAMEMEGGQEIGRWREALKLWEVNAEVM